MILKLQTYPTGWKFYASVLKIDYHYLELDQEQVNTALDCFSGLTCFIVGDDRCYIDICFETQAGIKYRIITGKPVYLCDDSGQTIEVINR